MKMDKSFIRQVVLYGVIGGASALLDFILFTLMHRQLGMNEYIANIISVHVGMAMSFLLNRKFNFKKTDKLLFRAGSFYLVGLLGLALSQCLLWFGSVLLLPVTAVKIASIFIVAIIQFFINRQVTFNK